jgi:hypothetical protein
MKALVVAVMVAILARAEVAGACSCSGPHLSFSPDSTDAPINSTVVIWMPESIGKLSATTFSLRKKTGESVPVDYRTMGSGSLGVLEMMPRTKLDPRTEYEIVSVTGNDQPRVAGKFETGTRSLTGKPTFNGFSKTGYYKAVPVCCMCMTDDPYAQLTMKDESPDDKSGDFRVAVWTAGADGKIDYAKPPTTYTRAYSELWLGHPSICSPANFSFAKSKTLKLGIKLVDIAGNASAPTEVVLDTTKPVKPPAR